jgi:hypothetical protein
MSEIIDKGGLTFIIVFLLTIVTFNFALNVTIFVFTGIIMTNIIYLKKNNQIKD